MNRSFGIELEIANITRDMLLEMTIETHGSRYVGRQRHPHL